MRFPLSRPSMSLYAALATRGPDPDGPASSGVRTMFLGTSTLLVRDTRTTVLIDGFFSRPPLWRIATGKIAPDPGRIDACLEKAGVTSLDAVLCAHAHYDHALDAPVIARKFGAPLIGSESAVKIGEGYGLSSDLLVRAKDGEVFAFGDFRVTPVHALHSPGDIAEGPVTEPLVPPARYTAWRSGQCYTFFLRHPAGSLLIHPSANHIPGKLASFHAETAYLSIGRLGSQSEEDRESYWRETVLATGAKTVLPIHWDDFMLPLDRPLRPMPFFMDDITPAMDFLERASRRDRVTLVVPTAWQETDPFGTWR
ncbi:MBL fold metallo-hydrolase [Actinocorallia aurea]